MSNFIIYIFAISIGVLITIVPILNGQNSLKLGTFKVSFFHYFSAFVTGLLFMSFLSPINQLIKLPSAPPQYFLGGLLGLAVILLMNYYAVKISALQISILPFLGQMTMGLMIDYWLLGQLEPKKIIGIAIVLVGLYIQSTSSIKVAESLT